MPESEAIKPGSLCPCGQTLPWHLFKLELGLRHRCSCQRSYDETAGVVRLVSAESNP